MTTLLYVCEDCGISSRDDFGSCPECGRMMVPAETVEAGLYPEE